MDYLDDPGDAEGGIIGDLDEAIVDLTNALIVEHVAVAHLNEEELSNTSTGDSYAVALAGHLRGDEDERRNMMLLLSSHGVATLILELSRCVTAACDHDFLAALMVGIHEG